MFYTLNLTPFFPREIFININNKCNMQCDYCFQHNKSNNTEQLTIDNIKTIEENISSSLFLKLFKPNIILTGGEPTINPDFVHIVNYFHKKNYNIKIISNGKITESFFQAIKPTQKKNIFISISLHDPDIEKITNKIKIFNQFYKQRNYLIGLSCVVDYLLINKINLKAFLRSLNALKLHQFIILHSLLPLHKEKLPEILSLKNQFLDLIKDPLFKKILFGPIIKFSDFEAFYFDNTFPPLSRKCNSPWLRCNILSNGNLIICAANNISGNILNNSLVTLWHNKENQNFRNLLRKEGPHFNLCKRCCGREFV